MWVALSFSAIGLKYSFQKRPAKPSSTARRASASVSATKMSRSMRQRPRSGVRPVARALRHGLPVAMQMRGKEIQAHWNVTTFAGKAQHGRRGAKTTGKRDARLVARVGPVMPAVIAAGIGIDR